MHITHKKLSFDIFMVGNLLNILNIWSIIFTYYPNDFWHKRKINNFDPYQLILYRFDYNNNNVIIIIDT